MPVYNGAVYLAPALDSILRQSYGDFEFLIIDDCSADQSREIIKSYHDPRIRLYENQENIGQTHTLNRGLRLATGEYLARQDQDDISLPTRFERQVEMLDRYPDIGLVGSQMAVIHSR